MPATTASDGMLEKGNIYPFAGAAAERHLHSMASWKKGTYTLKALQQSAQLTVTCDTDAANTGAAVVGLMMGTIACALAVTGWGTLVHAGVYCATRDGCGRFRSCRTSRCGCVAKEKLNML